MHELLPEINPEKIRNIVTYSNIISTIAGFPLVTIALFILTLPCWIGENIPKNHHQLGLMVIGVIVHHFLYLFLTFKLSYVIENKMTQKCLAKEKAEKPNLTTERIEQAVWEANVRSYICVFVLTLLPLFMALVYFYVLYTTKFHL
jgi:hypothetical protein